MLFSELLRQRQSTRAYADRPVEPDKLDQLIEAVRLSPSASNSQPWRLLMVTDPALKDRVARATYSTLVSFNNFVRSFPVSAPFA
jgi:nitroreductase